MPFLTPTLPLYPGLGLAGEYQKINPQAEFLGVRKFCYLGDMLNGEEGSRLASISRVGYDWKKSRELLGILTSKKVALRLKGKSMGHVFKVQ